MFMVSAPSALEYEAFHSAEFGHFIAIKAISCYNGWLKVDSEGKLKVIVETMKINISCLDHVHFLSCTELSAINSLCCISSVFTVYLTIKPFLTFNQWQSCSALIINSWTSSPRQDINVELAFKIRHALIFKT